MSDSQAALPWAHPKATRREWTGLAILALPCLLYSMDLTVLNLAIPQITADLKPSATEQLWILDIYGFFLAGALLTMGTLGDRIGRRKILLIGAGAFGAASVFAAFSTSPEMLIGARALLGVAAATLAPSTLSLIRNMFHDEAERQFAIGIWLASFSAGAAIGPVLGGIMLAYFWWGSVFLLNVPIMLALLAVAPSLLPEYRDPHAHALDLTSAALSIVAVLAMIWGIKTLAIDGFGLASVAAVAAGVAFAYVFYRRQFKLAEPLIDVALFRSAGFRTALLINLLMIFMAFGAFLVIAQYLQLVLGMGPLEAGLWTAPTGIVFVAGSLIAAPLGQRYSAATVIAGGLVVAAVGFFVLTFLARAPNLPVLMTGMLLYCAGLSCIGTLTTDFALGLAAPERAGAASGLSETSFEFGGALGMALLGSLVSAIYRGIMTATVPASVAAPEALETLSGAVATADALAGPQRDQLLSAARSAFSVGLAGLAFVCIAISLLTAYIAWSRLRLATNRTQSAAS